MCRCVSLLCAALLLPLVVASLRRQDADFEFADVDLQDEGRLRTGSHRTPRYVYDPDNVLCRALVCGRRETCALLDVRPRTALCVDERELRRDATERDREDDVFYDDARDRCVGCPERVRARFLCGSDNRTYSSLCRLDLHNCVRRPAPPVALACRGFCPCRSRTPRPRPDRARNEVVPRPEPCALDRLADRLLDWFSVLMRESSTRVPPTRGFPSDCRPEVRWMFSHLDAAGDGELSSDDLYALRHDDRERCLRPFLSSCGAGGGGGGGGGGLTRGAWCRCMRRASRPCTALARAHPRPRAGSYVPACDPAGYYLPRQCHAALGVCWCVDPHGVEAPGSRAKGAPRCPGAGPGAPADDEDGGGSGAGAGDGEPHY